jgi:K+:H+ antiporter
MLTSSPVLPLGAHSLLVFLVQLTSLLLLAVCLGQLAVRLGLPAVVGELFAGIVLGPSLLGQLAPGVSGWLLPSAPEQVHLLDAMASFSVLLLVGITGAQLDLKMIHRRGTTALRISIAGVVIPMVLGIGLGYVLPTALLSGGSHRTIFALFLGVAMGVSAIPVISKTLTDMGLLHRNVGQLTLAAGVVDDAVGWLLLSVVSAMATVGLTARVVGLSVLYLVGLIVAAAFVIRPLARWAFRLAARSAEAGPTIGIAGVLIIGCGAVSHALGLEAVVGAFIAGVVIAASGAEPARMAPLRTTVLSVLAPLFLAGAGLRMDLTALRHPVIIAVAGAALGVAVIGKFAGAYLGARLSRLNRWEGLALGAGMNARGVVEIVVASVGLRLGVLNIAMYTVIVLIAVMTSLMAPPLLKFAMKRVDQTVEETLREAQQRAWVDGRPSRAL